MGLKSKARSLEKAHFGYKTCYDARPDKNIGPLFNNPDSISKRGMTLGQVKIPELISQTYNQQ